MKKFLLVSLILVGITGCFNKKQSPEGDPVISDNSTYTIVLEGYKEGSERRDFKKALDQYDTYGEAKQLNYSSGHAEYMLSPDASHSDWLEVLTQTFGDRYTIQQEGKRILFIRKDN